MQIKCDLSGPEATWDALPLPSSAYAAAIDPALGRVKLPCRRPCRRSRRSARRLQRLFRRHGGGETASGDLVRPRPEQQVIEVSGHLAGTPRPRSDALGGDGVVEVTDSRRYADRGRDQRGGAAGGHIELRGRDGSRPTLSIEGEISVTGGKSSQFDMNGLLVISTAAPAAKGPVALVHAPAAD